MHTTGKQTLAKWLWIAAALLITLAGCATGNPGSTAGREEGLLVYATSYPMYDFASKIGGDRAEVRSLVASGVELHDWEPTPRDIVALEQADLLVCNGAGLETWLDKITASLQNEDLVVVDTAVGLELLEEDEHQDRHGEDGHEDEEDQEDGHRHHGVDPHVWLSPLNAASQMKKIALALAQADAENKDYYMENLARWTGELTALDGEYREALEHVERRAILVDHASFGYLCRDYGLEQRAAAGYSPDTEPDPASMAALVDYAREKDIRVVFHESGGNGKVAGAIAREIGGETAVLHTLESRTAAEEAAGEDYFFLMRANLEALRLALM